MVTSRAVSVCLSLFTGRPLLCGQRRAAMSAIRSRVLQPRSVDQSRPAGGRLRPQYTGLLAVCLSVHPSARLFRTRAPNSETERRSLLEEEDSHRQLGTLRGSSSPFVALSRRGLDAVKLAYKFYTTQIGRMTYRKPKSC